jgi:RNA polymerase sigma factor (sigma-70 family)
MRELSRIEKAMPAARQAARAAYLEFHRPTDMMDDYISEAYLKLCECDKAFDESRGVPYEKYVYSMCIARCRDYSRDGGYFSGHVAKKYKLSTCAYRPEIDFREFIDKNFAAVDALYEIEIILAMMKPTEEDTFLLRMQGHTLVETAKILGISKQAVFMRERRIRRIIENYKKNYKKRLKKPAEFA